MANLKKSIKNWSSKHLNWALVATLIGSYLIPGTIIFIPLYVYSSIQTEIIVKKKIPELSLWENHNIEKFIKESITENIIETSNNYQLIIWGILFLSCMLLVAKWYLIKKEQPLWHLIWVIVPIA